MNNNIEAALSALFAALQASVVIDFTADGSIGSPVLQNVSNFTNIFAGIGAFGPGVPRGATISSFDSVAKTITLSANLTAASTGGSFQTGFLTTGRRVQMWTNVAAQPALFLRHISDTDEYLGGNQINRTKVEAEIWIYSKAGQNPDLAPDIALNNLVRLVRQSFAPDQQGTRFYTIGGTVSWCRIEGRTDYDPGDLDAQAKAVIPVVMTLP